MSEMRVIINFQHVECMFLTSETVVSMRFISGESLSYVFVEPVAAENAMIRFTDWCNGFGAGGLVIRQEELK